MPFEREPIEFSYLPISMIALAVLGVGMTVASGVLAFRLLPNMRPDQALEFVGYCGVVFFGAATILIVWRIVTAKGPVVVITETGFTDRRLAPEEIPWSAIDRIGIVEMQGQKILVLDVDPAAEASLHLTRTVRWSRRANAALGVKGLATTAQGLNVDFATLVDLCRARRDVVRAASED